MVKIEIELLTGMILLSDPKNIQPKGLWSLTNMYTEYFASEAQKINENPENMYESIIDIKYKVSDSAADIK